MFHHAVVAAIISLSAYADILKDFQARSEKVLHADVKSCKQDGTCSSNVELSPNGQVLGRVVYNVDHRDRNHPLIQFLNERSTAMNAKFRSLSSRSLMVWYDDGGEGTEQANLKPGMESTTNTYIGHRFYVTPHSNKSHILQSFEIKQNQVLYAIEDSEYPAIQDVLAKHNAENNFNIEYTKRTGIPWRHYFGPEGPRPPPVLFMWPAAVIGDVHTVESTQGYWSCADVHCRSAGPLKLELEVVSTHPKVFIIENFLSDYEVEAVIETGRPKVAASWVGNEDGGGIRASATRTSSNTWIQRSTSPLFDALYRRAADLLQLDEKLLQPNQNSEEIQVVHYAVGQKYDSHHDWGVAGYPLSRYITLLLYLTDQPNPNAGGETAFPKGADGMGFKVLPKKRTAVLFYNLLEDGNGDDLALHAAMPVLDGEKWLCNFWVWDPKRR